MSKKRRRRNPIPEQRESPGAIPRPSQPDLPKCVVFSFKYMDLAHARFGPQHAANGYLEQLLQRLKSVCAFAPQEFLANRSASLRCHPIEFHQTTEQGGFPLNEQLSAAPAYQFSVTANEHGRVHGFFIADVFYVVWLDPGHALFD